MVTIKKIVFLVFVISTAFLSTANASPENDRVYQLETLSWLKAADNVDGIFADYLDEIYQGYFKKQSRFQVKKLTGIDQVLGKSSMSYIELIQNKDLIKKVAQKFKAESIIRTRVYKEAETYRFVMEWVYAPRGDILSQFEFRYIDPKKEGGLEGSDLPNAVRDGLDQLIAKLPFLGQVTGIEGETITVNIGRNQRVHPRDIFNLYTLQSVKRHPILNRIEEWRFVPTGRAQVEQVEESISFARVIETEPGQSIIRYQKIKEIVPAPPEAATASDDHASQERERPRIGWIAGNLGVGNYSREVGSPTTSQGRTGGGLLGTFEIDSLLWLNSRWLTEASLMAGILNYSVKDLSTNAALNRDYSGSSSQMRLAVGYSLFPAKTIFDAIAWIHGGLRYSGYSLPTNTTDSTGGSDFTSIFIGFGGEVPVARGFTAQMNLDLGVLRSASQKSPNFGDPSASTDLMFSVGGTYRLEERVALRLLIKLNSQAMDFIGGQTVSQKMLSVAPSIMYYF
jgi:hypothetical protein